MSRFAQFHELFHLVLSDSQIRELAGKFPDNGMPFDNSLIALAIEYAFDKMSFHMYSK